MTEAPVKRGVGIKFRTTGLTEAALEEWAFDNVGQPVVFPRTDGHRELRAHDHDEHGKRGYGLYIGFVEKHSTDPQGRLRIGVWGILSVDDAWKIIGEWAKNLVASCGCELNAHAHDLHEDGKGLIYDEQLPPGKTLGVIEVPVKREHEKGKPARMH